MRANISGPAIFIVRQPRVRTYLLYFEANVSLSKYFQKTRFTTVILMTEFQEAFIRLYTKPAKKRDY